MRFIDKMDMLENRPAANEVDYADIIVGIITHRVPLHEPTVALDQVEYFRFFIGAAVAVNLEDPDMHVEIFMKDGFDYFFPAGFDIDCPEDPVFRLVLNPETGLIAIPLDDKIPTADANDLSPHDAHRVGRVGDYLGQGDNRPTGKLTHPKLYVFTFVHAELPRQGI